MSGQNQWVLGLNPLFQGFEWLEIADMVGVATVRLRTCHIGSRIAPCKPVGIPHESVAWHFSSFLLAR